MKQIIRIGLVAAGMLCLSACKPGNYYPFGYKPGGTNIPSQVYYTPPTDHPVSPWLPKAKQPKVYVEQPRTNAEQPQANVVQSKVPVAQPAKAKQSKYIEQPDVSENESTVVEQPNTHTQQPKIAQKFPIM
ncbi:MAG TPA: hypothetical protein VHE99_06005 [Gammaproteobacteria bacterium]|nr:hypothetical protein [Gammaproteobacteria bacterium]